MTENNIVEQQVAQAILDRGTRHKVGKRSVTIRPLKFGTTLAICREMAAAGLTLQAVQEGTENIPEFVVKYADLMLRSIALAEINEKFVLWKEKVIRKKMSWYNKNLTNYQVYELFAFVVNLSGMEDFMSTIRLMITMKAMNLSPRKKGS